MIPSIKNFLVNNKHCILLYGMHVSDGGVLYESRGRGFATASEESLLSYYSTTRLIPGMNSYVTATNEWLRNLHPTGNTQAIGSHPDTTTIRLSTTTDVSNTWDKPGKRIKITGSSSNDGYYTVVSASHTGSPLRTEIIIAETLPATSEVSYGTLTWDDPFGFGTGDFTLEGVFRPVYDSIYAYRNVCGNYYSQGMALECDFVNSTNWALNVYCAGSNVFDIITDGTYNTWYHVLVTRKAGYLRVYVNGVLKYYGANAGNLSALNTFVVGSDATGTNSVSSSFYFNGDIQRVGVWNKCMFNDPCTTTGKKRFTTSWLRKLGNRTDGI